MSTDARLLGQEAEMLRSWRLGDGTHRNHLLLLALLGQVLDAVDEELVGADVGPSGLDHPAAQLHQLGEQGGRGGKKQK